jgi:hypothetical protein
MSLLMAGENFEDHPFFGLVAVMGSNGFSLANFKIFLRELSDMFNCSLILFRGIPAFYSSMAVLFFCH